MAGGFGGQIFCPDGYIVDNRFRSLRTLSNLKLEVLKATRQIRDRDVTLVQVRSSGAGKLFLSYVGYSNPIWLVSVDKREFET
jgi:hypothetical protein